MTGISLASTDAKDDDYAVAVGNAKVQKRWVQEIQFYERKSDQWIEKGKKILRRYKDDRSPREQKVPRFNILWSNIQTLKPCLFSRVPKADIERRFRDKDDLGRFSSQVLERATQYFLNEQFESAISQAVTDRLLPGRGTVWVRYEPHFKDPEIQGNEEERDDGFEITDDVNAYAGDEANEGASDSDMESYEQLGGEDVCYDYVHWMDFGHTFGRTWEEVDAGWRKVYLTRSELKKRFGNEIGTEINLDYSPHDLKDNKEDEVEKKATIYEIWCKSDKKVYWIHKEHITGPLDMQDDPLRLEGFFPFPRPLFATLANDTCIPVSDYQEYQDQANELDELTSRIGAITKAVKVAGVYDASAEGIERILAEGTENQLIPVKQWAVMSEKGGISNAYALLPMQEILQTLLGLYEARDKVKSDLYEITGIADIIRGASDPNETAAAQSIKSKFGTMRLQSSQDEVQRFCRDLVRIGAQIIAEHFSVDTIKKISGVQLATQQEKMMLQSAMQPPMMGHNGGPPMQAGAPPAPQSMQQPPRLPPPFDKMDKEDIEEMLANPSWEDVYALLRDETMLSYKIDIETDSTIKFDQDNERDQRTQFLQAAGGFIKEAMQVSDPSIMPLMAKMLEFGIRGFKIGKELESAFENAIAKIEKQAANPQQKPDPEAMKAQLQMQVEQAKLQANMQLEQMRLQTDKEKIAADAQAEAHRLQVQAQVDTNQAKLDAQNEMLKQQNEQQSAQMEQQTKMAIAKLDAETKLAVAQIQAKTQLQTTALSKTTPEEGGVSVDESGTVTKQPGMADLMATVVEQLQQSLAGVQQSHAMLAQAISKPKQVVRDENGNIVGVH